MISLNKILHKSKFLNSLNHNNRQEFKDISDKLQGLHREIGYLLFSDKLSK